MAYEFTLDVMGVRPGDMDEIEKALKEMEVIGYALQRDDFTENQFYASGQALWSNHKENMRSLSVRFPTLLFCLYIDDTLNMSVEYHQNGKMQAEDGEMTYPPFNPDKLR